MRTGKVAFIGMGIIGAGLAVNALTAGNECVLYDVADLEASKTRLYNILGSMVEAEAISADVAHEAYGRARFTNDLSE